MKKLAALFALVAAPPALASDARMIFTSPACPSYRYEQPVKQNDGAMRAEKFGQAYCTSKDRQMLGKKAQVEKAIRKIMLDADFRIREMDVAHYIFSDDSLSRLVCQKYAIQPFALRLLIPKAEPGQYTAPYAVERLKNCMGNDFALHKIGCDVFKVSDESGKSICPDGLTHPEIPIQVMHLKLIAMRGDKNGVPQAVIITGSGNVGRGMYSNFEDWDFFTVPEGSALDHQHRCMVDTILVSERDSLDAKRMAKVYEACAAQAKNSSDGITTLFLPAEADKYTRQLLDAIGQAKTISIAALQFKSDGLRDALIAAKKRGATVRLLMDDNNYYAGLTGKDFDTAFAEDHRNHTAPLKAQGIALRFLETNHEQSRLQNLLHHRFVITENGEDVRVFTGSAHLIDDAMHFNFESQYVFSTPILINTYLQGFDALWERALPWEKMPAALMPAEKVTDAQ